MSDSVEQLLVRVYADVLEIPEDQIGLEESFIGLGGDSFKAIKLKRKCDHLGIRLSLRDIFTRKTISAIAAKHGRVREKPKRLSVERQNASTITGMHGHFPLMLQDYSWDTVLEELGLKTFGTEVLELVENIYPCSPMQESIYVARETRGKQLYRIHALFEIESSITNDALHSAWQSIIDRHESLRTVFVPSTDAGSSRILDAIVLKSVPVHSKLELVDCDDYAAVHSLYQDSCMEPQDFSKGPPHRLRVYRTRHGQQFCLFDQSHMISDATSLVNTVKELGAALKGSLPAETAPGYSKVIQYRQEEQHLESGLEYWKLYMNGAQPCNFPSIWTNNGSTDSFSQECRRVVNFEFSRHAELSEFCIKLETTVSTVLQTAWALLLRVYTGNDEVCFGYTSSGRDIPVTGVETVCGPLVNLIVRRVIFDNQTARGVIRNIQEDFANSLAFQRVPFMKVQQLLRSTEDKMFNTIVTVDFAPLLIDGRSDIPLRMLSNFNASDFGLSLQVLYSETAMKMQLTYSTSLLPAIMAERVTKTFGTIIESLLDSSSMDVPIGQLLVISDSDKQQVMRWNQETLHSIQEPLPDATVHGLVENVAIHTPHAAAIYFSGETFSYKDLDSMSTCLAHTILSCLSPEQRFVPLFFEKSPLYSIALLAVMKSGVAFVPVDVSNPVDRIKRILEQLGITPAAGLVISSETQSEKLRSTYQHVLVPSVQNLRDEAARSQALEHGMFESLPEVKQGDPAYVIFTSGSTGNPKGVLISHGAYTHAARAHASGIAINSESRVLQFASYAFDTSMEDHLTTFIVGACLCVPTETERETSLVEFINDSRANWVHITPSMVDMISPESVESLNTIVLGGEPMTKRNVTQWATPGRHLIQVYGPSECSVTSTIESDTRIHRDPTNIGRTFGGCATWITDPNDPTILYPLGAVGELLVEGPILALGYLGQPSATESAFVTDLSWAPRRRFYRTGDLVRYDEQGKLHFVGRADSRVKLRGQRIECGEIESHLVTQDAVFHALVIVPKSGPGVDHLISVISLKEGEESSHLDRQVEDIQLADSSSAQTNTEIAKGLHYWLGSRLPAYMLPDLFIFVRKIPMNSSRKLDRKRVVKYVENMSEQTYRRLVSQMDGPDQHRAGTELESLLKKTWCRVLNLSESSVNWNTSWFSLGGDSISAMMLTSELRKQSINIIAADVLRLRNIERIASHIQDSASNDENNRFQDVDLAKTVSDVAWNLSPIQQLSFQYFADGDYLDQQTMIVDTTLDLSNATIIAALNALVAVHPMLLARFSKDASTGRDVWNQRVAPGATVGSAYRIRFHQDGHTTFKLGCISESKRAIDIVNGPIMGVDVFRFINSITISFSIHHLVVDMVSWRTIFQDLEDFIVGSRVLQPEPVSFQSWCQVQQIYSQSIEQSQVLPEDKFIVDTEYWSMTNTPNLFGDSITTSFEIGRLEMANLLEACDKLEYDQTDIFCAAILTSFSITFPNRAPPAVFIEGHGRESPSNTIDLSRTVGWFTTLAPVAIEIQNDTNEQSNATLTALEHIKKFRDGTPARGFDYFTSRFQNNGLDAYSERHAPAEIILNYLGSYQQLERSGSAFRRCDDTELLSGVAEMRREQRKNSERYALISIVAAVEDGVLSFEVEWNRKMSFQEDLAQWPLKIKQTLSTLTKDLMRLSVLESEQTAPTKLELVHFGVDKQKVLTNVMSLGLRPQEIESIYPCSPMQEGLMASLLRDSDKSSAYTQTFLYRLQLRNGGTVDMSQLSKVWSRVVQKHAILRTIFVETEAGDYAQVVLHHYEPITLTKSGVSEDEVRNTLFDSENLLLPPPLDGAPLHRFMICETDDNSTYVLLTKSHLLTDGISSQILIQDLSHGYDGVVEQYWNPQNYYRDYVRYLSKQDIGEVRRYWASYLAGASTCNFPRLLHIKDSEIKVSHSSVTSQIPAREDDLRQLCRAHDLTVSNVFQLAWVLVLRVYLKSESILFGFLSSGRDLPIPGIQEAVGPVATMLPIRSELSRDMKAIDVAKSLQEEYIDHLSRQTLSLAQIQHAARNENQSPSFNTILNIQESRSVVEEPSNTNTQVELVKWVDTTEYGLALTVAGNKNDYGLSLEYDTSLISAKQAENIISAFATAVQSIIALPDSLVGDVDLVCDEDRQQIQQWDIGILNTTSECVHDLFQRTACSMPEKEAIYAWDGRLTYGELEVLTNYLAQTLIDFGVQPEEIIPLCFEKSIWGIVAQISVMKAGATFVHLDPSSPISRKEQIIKITGSRIAISSVHHKELMETLVSQTFSLGPNTLLSYDIGIDPIQSRLAKVRVDPSSAIYLIFTSGSTGEPKGVVIEHQNYCSAMTANTDWLQINPSARILQFSSFSFDASMEEILTALVAGACVCVPSDDDRMSPEGLTSFIQDARVNWAALTPSLLQTLEPDALVPPLNFITFHAEPMTASLTKLWSPRVHMRPSYGPTECTVTSTVGTAFTEFSDPSNIGWPVGCHGRITDPEDAQKLVPIGAIGELVLEGPILCRGYLKRPEDTAKAFPHIQDWFNGELKRVYRTGDLVRYNADDGSLRILGRRDSQIKVRGQRVQLEEVKGEIDLSSEVHHSLVIQPKSGPLQGRLVAVVSFTRPPLTSQPRSSGRTLRLVNQSDATQDFDHSATSKVLNDLRLSISARLPSYMIPHAWFVVDDIPTLPSCKLDRKLTSGWLEGIDEATLQLARQLMSGSRIPSNSINSNTEQLVRSAWSQVLAIPEDSIDVNDHFISLGGDSITGMHVSRFLNQAGMPVKTQDVLRSNSIRELSLILDSRGPQGSGPVQGQPHDLETEPTSLPSIQDIRSKYGLDLSKHPKILSIQPATPFQLRTTSALQRESWRPCLYNRFVEISRHEAVEQAIDHNRLQDAWLATVARHQILRTAVVLGEDGKSAYQIVMDASAVACEIFEVSTEEEALNTSVEKTNQVKASLSEPSLKPLLWLSIIITHTKQVYVHLLVGHMLIDSVSLAHLFYDWDMYYRGLSLPTHIPQFAAYVDNVKLRDHKTSTEFWVSRLKGVEPTILPSTSGKLGQVPSPDVDTLTSIDFKIAIDASMYNYCRAMRITVSTLLQFAWAVLLGTYTGRNSVCFGHVASDRDIDMDDADEIVGPLLSFLVTHVSLESSGDSTSLSIEEALQKLQHDSTASIAHRVFDLQAVESQLGLQPPAGTLFNTLINYRKVKRSGPVSGMALRTIRENDPYEVSQTAVLPRVNN
ncbi:peptide synthetase [Xylariales sp. PMI_506]|nr:peptide synthetase [Xylariales sp. PMI_506]